MKLVFKSKKLKKKNIRKYKKMCQHHKYGIVFSNFSFDLKRKLLVGPYMVFNSLGSLLEKHHYIEGKLVGESIFYYSNNFLNKKINYDKDGNITEYIIYSKKNKNKIVSVIYKEKSINFINKERIIHEIYSEDKTKEHMIKKIITYIRSDNGLNAYITKFYDNSKIEYKETYFLNKEESDRVSNNLIMVTMDHTILGMRLENKIQFYL